MLTDTMSILFNTTVLRRWEVVVDDMHNIMNVEATSRDACSDQDGILTQTERANTILTLTLGAIAMNGDAGEVLVEQKVVKLVSSTLAIDEDDGTSRRGRQEQVLYSTTLHGCLNIDDILLDVQVGATSTANSNANMNMSKVGLGKITSLLREGSGKQHVLDVSLLLVYFQLAYVISPNKILTYHHQT